MTGYGRGEALFGDKKIVCEVRSVNHRFLDVSIRIPKAYMLLETEIRKQVAARTARGKVDVSIQVESAGSNDLNVEVNTAKAKHMYDLLLKIGAETGIPGDVTMETVLSFRDMFFGEADEGADAGTLSEPVATALDQALLGMQQMQNAEGQEIGRDMHARLTGIEGAIGEIAALAPASLAARQSALKERVQALCNGVDVDEARMAQEIAIMADKNDITEELVRAGSHVKQFVQWLDTRDAVGRKLDFIIQEINREINTIGSKAADSDVSQKVVIIKNELEKIREQVQNVM